MSSLVSLRLVERTDAADVQRYAADPGVAQTSNVPHPYPEDGGVAYVERVIAGRETGHQYAFVIQYDGHFAGIMTLNAVDREAGTAELDYWVAVPFWNQGIGTTAARAAIQYAFEELDLSFLQSACLVRNPASARVLEKTGFSEVREFINDGTFGLKFKGERMKRFRLPRTDWERQY